ncbi:hypothetical protein Clacol_004188 [Clathrus columnatus]|uniref:Fungal-type protein kinase domain-containing protein n=1 Tax=Clathrus columnatus TaxID=1419009 RepID=A0AAV5A926_9AGAM|nr:hypothetical protein Clacol_004188 [Clathrus columnatus]
MYRDRRMGDMIYDVQDHIVGPMPLKEFVNLFLPLEQNESHKEFLKFKFDRELLKMVPCTKETDMYCHFIEAMKVVCPEFPAVDTSSTGFSSFEGIRIKPDISYFPKGIRDHTDITNVEMMAEFKILDSDDTFTNPDERFESNVEELLEQGSATLSQIVAYATAHMASRFRTHLFSLLLLKEHGRILFWDRAGVVVTERFLLTHEYFMEFFIRCNHATKQQRGHDITVNSLSHAETLIGKALFPKSKCAKLVKISIDSKDYVTEHPTWMGSRPLFGPDTRGFVAYPMLESLASGDKPPPVFIKDTWRILSRRREDLVYSELHQKQVPSSDRVQEIMATKKDTQAIILQHFRLVLSEVGSSLTTFRSTKELVLVFHDALQAHKAAYEEASILHGDISAGNILIGPDRRGLLVDWDLSKSHGENQPVSDVTEIQGTWQFLAARLFQPVPKGGSLTRDLTDELESFVHVLMWVACRYTPITCGPGRLRCFYRTNYDGNEGKIDYLTGGIALSILQNSLLQDLSVSLCQVVGVRYQATPNELDVRPVPFHLIVEDYKKRLSFLGSSQWIIGTFEKFLEKTDWPVGDAAKENSMDDLEDHCQEPWIKKKNALEIWGDRKHDI